MRKDRLLADIGGTNARFGWQTEPGAPVTDVIVLACAEHPSLADAIKTYLKRLGRMAPGQCAIAIANPVLGDLVKMTNHHWTFSISALKSEFGFDALRVLNDFCALALALPALSSNEVRALGGDAADHGKPIGLIGPGTGLGVSGLLPDGRGGWMPLESEGGHVTLAGRTARERQALEHLGMEFSHVSAERVISGPGIEALHRAVRKMDRVDEAVPPLVAAEVVRRALEDADWHCLEALELFCSFLGNAAGNLALTLCARGGIFIGGGIVPRLGRFIDRSPFRARFEDKGRYGKYLAAIPVFIITANESPALRGAALGLDAQLLGS